MVFVSTLCVLLVSISCMATFNLANSHSSGSMHTQKRPWYPPPRTAPSCILLPLTLPKVLHWSPGPGYVWCSAFWVCVVRCIHTGSCFQRGHRVQLPLVPTWRPAGKHSNCTTSGRTIVTPQGKPPVLLLQSSIGSKHGPRSHGIS